MKAPRAGVIVGALLFGSTTSVHAQATYRSPTAVFRDSQAAVPLFSVRPTFGPFVRDSAPAAPTALTIG